jgi:putative Mn2+ efflux pump MntP
VGLAETLGIAAALGVDCLAVSAAMGAAGPRKATAAAVAALFGSFQLGMTLAGMYGGAALGGVVHSSLRFAAPVLVAAIGILMIAKGIKCEQPSGKLVGAIAVVGAAISVSLDALAAGVALGLLEGLSLMRAGIIGAVSAGMSLLGFAGGRALARRTRFAEDIGGGFLIVLAVAMLLSSR